MHFRGACVARGVHGGGGACVVAGGAWQGGAWWGACMAGGQAWQRLCVAGGHPPAGTTRYGIHPCSECYCVFIHRMERAFKLEPVKHY